MYATWNCIYLKEKKYWRSEMDYKYKIK
uniref:Uncharacterized protein n=1 Tax=Anguilla anguilla TaxID=7936 RepID=A0A0E9PC55_ANGAN